MRRLLENPANLIGGLSGVSHFLSFDNRELQGDGNPVIVDDKHLPLIFLLLNEVPGRQAGGRKSMGI